MPQVQSCSPQTCIESGDENHLFLGFAMRMPWPPGEVWPPGLGGVPHSPDERSQEAWKKHMTAPPDVPKLQI